MPSRFFDVIQNYTEKDIISLIFEIEKILKREPNLYLIPRGKVMVVGDLHGDLETLHKIINLFFRDKFNTLLFLGDYVDRGPNQVEVVNVLFYYKKLMPDKIVLIRGNHEDPIINRQYGFYDEVRIKYNDNKLLYRLYNEAFSLLPLAAITWNNIFCVHAGIPEGLEKIEDINFLPNCIESPEDPISKQLLWNDPKEKIKAFKYSLRGPGIKRFGRDAFYSFILRNKIKYVIRSHEKFKQGYKSYFDDKLLSIFTSRSYSKKISTVIGVINANGNIEIQEI
ncbi:MAG: metallophosphoesterase [Promethearchaeota archaeon]